MRTSCLVLAALAILLLSSCGPQVNAPADEKAIEELETQSAEAMNNRDLDWFRSNYYTEDAVVMPPNQMELSGVDAILANEQASYEIYTSSKLTSQVGEVQSSGDLAVASGTYYWTATPAGSGLSDMVDEGKWIATYSRQDDGSWKCSKLIYNSDRPAAGATADGTDEKALLQIESDWLNAAINKDRDALDKILADNFVGNGEEGVKNKRQEIAEAMSSAFKLESAEHSNLQPMVFGDTAVVNGMTAVKGTERGKEIDTKYRWTDIFQKNDGSWQCVISYGTEVK